MNHLVEMKIIIVVIQYIAVAALLFCFQRAV